MGPYYSDTNLVLFQVARPVRLPVRRPTSQESSSLGAAPTGTPYPRAPFLKVEDESLEVHYVISNLDADAHLIWMLIEPWNEFVRWNPGVTVVNGDESTPNFGYDLSFLVPGMSRVQGTVTPDDMHEIAIKLAAAEKAIASAATIDAMAAASNGPTTTEVANHIFNVQNWSSAPDPLYTPWIPPVIAGVTGFDLGLRVVGGRGQMQANVNIAVEITVEVQDLNGNRFVAQDQTTAKDWISLPPKVLSPPNARF